ncbi:Na+/H+ antiporter subunit D [Mycobacterium barrassiae]|uniref:Na+/H+ antiporter subunit D n=1 Tax=Mycobacterium barrassiae TaxID=319709 RepID=UPI002265B5C5|nr:Na+/H+ antiporter subunit D [Mycobacterium barrassiae]MCV7302775.1 Na+/H+ antiporter subunit D [Mycobacterium barrassiae]
MNLPATLMPLPVLIPTLGAAATLIAGRRPRLQRLITLIALSIVVAVCAALLVLADREGTLVLNVGGWGQSVPGMGPLGITLVVDRLSALMLVVSSIVLLAVVFYAIGQGIRDGDERQPVSIFMPTYLVLSAGVYTAFLAGDLFNLFVGFEVLLAASFVLLTIGASKDRVRAGISYVMVSMVSSLIFLFGIALVYAATGTLNMAEIAVRLDDVSTGTRSAIFAVLLVAFGIKAAVFPLSGWLPDSYPTAPAPVTAVFAGLLTKVGVYAIIRAHSLLFPSGGLDPVLLVAALFTMLIGILGAIAQNDIKRLLSFTLVSHIGYMVFGIALANALGMSGAIYYVAHHILVQTTLFLVVGLIERQAGASTMDRLGGLAAASPLLAFVFVVPALNLGGIPPFSGFIGKVALLEAGAQVGSVLAWTLVGGGVVTSLLTLYVVARVWTRAFWRSRADAPEGHLSAASPSALLDEPEDIQFVDRDNVGRMPAGMVAPTGALIAVGLALTVFAGPIFSYSERAADEVLDRGQYISAVVGTP